MARKIKHAAAVLGLQVWYYPATFKLRAIRLPARLFRTLICAAFTLFV